MSNKSSDIFLFDASSEKRKARKFWLYVFLMYALAEMIYLSVNYTITRTICAVCVLPIPFYVITWLESLVFTGFLWYTLSFFYSLNVWKTILLNIAVFVAYYFSWITILYLLFHSDQKWLIGKAAIPGTYESYIFSSWDDIGKYVFILAAFYVLKFYYEYRKAERQRTQLAVINKDMQVNLLKQQLSPHFYFNTLNNLYGLARSNNKNLSAALSQLSNIMQYVIVDCNQPKVLLREEISFLESYIALEKLRYEHDAVIEMNIKGKAEKLKILPLILIQFVENAFKHGMKEKSSENWMKVKLDIDNEEIAFKVENSYYQSNTIDGIGIKSIERILFLKYEGKYDLVIDHKSNYYSVTLKLNLS